MHNKAPQLSVFQPSRNLYISKYLLCLEICLLSTAESTWHQLERLDQGWKIRFPDGLQMPGELVVVAPSHMHLSVNLFGLPSARWLISSYCHESKETQAEHFPGSQGRNVTRRKVWPINNYRKVNSELTNSTGLGN